MLSFCFIRIPDARLGEGVTAGKKALFVVKQMQSRESNMKKILMVCVLSAGLALGARAEDEGGVAPRSFEVWLDEFREEALAKGIKPAVLDDAFEGIEEPSEKVLEKDQTQPEVKLTFPQYIHGQLTERKVAVAKAAWTKNKNMLIRIENEYDVPAPVLLALWGTESNFGKIQGKHSIIESLVTLAFDGRRSDFFHDQLLDALRIMQQEHIKAANLLGSWAGAMGQVQFMPSSFLKYAVDFNRDGKKDIWKSTSDSLASIANYLHQKGWDSNTGWGVAVALPEDSKMDWSSMKERFPLSTWKKYGVRQKNGDLLRGIKEEARLVLLDGDVNMAYLVYPNYDIIMDWNRSVYFATTIGLLADAIGEDE